MRYSLGKNASWVAWINCPNWFAHILLYYIICHSICEDAFYVYSSSIFPSFLIHLQTLAIEFYNFYSTDFIFLDGLDLQKIWPENTDSFHIPPLPTFSFPCYWHLALVCHMHYNWLINIEKLLTGVHGLH